MAAKRFALFTSEEKLVMGMSMNYFLSNFIAECMGQIPNTMMLRVVQEIYHSSFRIPLSLRLRGIRKLVVVYFLYSTQHHCISYSIV